MYAGFGVATKLVSAQNFYVELKIQMPARSPNAVLYKAVGVYWHFVKLAL